MYNVQYIVRYTLMPLDDTKCDGLGGTQQESVIQHLDSQINAQYSLNLKSAHITTTLYYEHGKCSS